jgi:hypothetical protein
MPSKSNKQENFVKKLGLLKVNDESGFIGQRHGSANPDPHQNVMEPEHWLIVYLHDAPHVDINAVAGVHLQTFALIRSSQSHVVATVWSEKVF